MNSKELVEGYVGELDGEKGRKKCNCVVISKKKGRVDVFKSLQKGSLEVCLTVKKNLASIL